MDRRLVYDGPSPPLFPWAWSTSTGFMRGWPARGVFPCFSHGGAPVGGERPVSLRGGAGVQLGRGETSPGHGDHDAGVEVLAGAF